MYTSGSDTTGFEMNQSILAIIDVKSLKRMQEQFCSLIHVFAFCMDNNGQWITDFSGNPDEVSVLRKCIPTERFSAICKRIADSNIEDQVIEDTKYPNLKIAAVSVKDGDRPMLYWLICGVISDADDAGYVEGKIEGINTQITEKEFNLSLDLMRNISNMLVNSKLSLANAMAENRRNQFTQKEMSHSLRRTEAITEIVQHLESEEQIESVLYDIIKITGIYLNISSAQVFKLNKSGLLGDILAEWCNNGIVSVFDQTRNIEINPLLNHDKTLVISSDSKVTEAEKAALKSSHIKAIIAVPIIINGVVSMYVCFNECKSDKVWLLDDIRFANDAAKIIRSILVRRIQKNSLASSFTSLEAILDNIGSAVYVKDLETKQVLFANRMLKNNFASELKEGSLNSIFEKTNMDAAKDGSYEVYYEAIERWYDLHYTYIIWVDGRKVALCAIYDITEKKVYQRKIEQQAYTDFLTGLYNRMCCERDLATQIDKAKKENKTGALLYLDLDDFKHINDGLGHQYGDVLLKAISHSLQRIEGIQTTCYRMGGDEFVIIVPPEQYPRFNLIQQEITNIFSKPWFLKDADYYCTMSMGTVDFPGEGENVPDLIKKADIAMYEAKKSGKNRVAHYTANINSSSNKRLDMEKNMRDATVSGFQEFEVYYQPIIDIQLDGTPCTGAEALIRWNSSELGFVTPAEFIPLAEYLGLINPIGNHVLQEACKACKYWNDNGKPDYKVNVNLSVVQLLQADIVEIVEDIIKETQLKPHNLTLEVTESLAINDMKRMKEILGSIKKLGVRIALDDFGIGYSSLNHIREIPLDVIKVDQSFVNGLAEDTYSQSFIKMVSELASAIDVSICVEGIETAEQYKVLEGMKVRLVQGYYFDKPMTKDNFEIKYLRGESK